MRWEISPINSDYSIDFFKNDIGALLDDLFSFRPFTLSETDWLPKIEVKDDEKAIFVRAEIPGLDEKDIEVNLKENILTISGEKKEEKTEEDKKKNYKYSERRYGSFSRAIRLPEGIKGDEVKASYKNGLLEVELPKGESVQPKKIDVNTTVN